MAERRPLVLVNGELQELPSGDTLPGAGGVQNNYAATTDPAVSNDDTEGYEVGSVWVNTTADTAWVCLDASTGAAVWTESTAAGGGGASIFTALTDTPSTYTGQAGKALQVNPGETGLEFVDFPSGGGGGGTTDVVSAEWELHEHITATGVTSHIVDITGLSEVRVIVRSVATSINGFAVMTLCTNADGTGEITTGGYVYGSESGSTEAGGAFDNITFGDQSNTFWQYGNIHFHGMNLANVKSSFEMMVASNSTGATVNRSGMMAAEQVENALKIEASAGNFTNCDIYVLRRKTVSISGTAGGGTQTVSAFQGFYANKAGGSAQAISNNTFTVVVYDNEVFDTASGYDPTTGVYTVPASLDGKYMRFDAGILNVSFTVEDATLLIFHNGNNITRDNRDTTDSYHVSSPVIQVATGDTIEVQIYTTTASVAADRRSWFSGYVLNPDIDIAAAADGKTILNGTVDPTTEGVDGDFYINTTSNTIFGPKASGTWPAGVSLVGPAGSDGAQGPAGPAGADGADGAPGTNGVDGADGAIGFISDNLTNDGSLTASGSAFASKGALIKPRTDILLNSVEFMVDGAAPTQTVDISVVRLSELNPGTIAEVVHDIGTLSQVNPANGTDFVFSTPLKLLADTWYGIIFVRTDGTTTSPLAISFPGSGGIASDPQFYWDGQANAGIRYASVQPAVSDTVYDSSLAAPVQMRLNVELDRGFVPAGGTAGQVLSKVDGADYNTQWIDQSGGVPVSSTMTGAFLGTGEVTTSTASDHTISVTLSRAPVDGIILSVAQGGDNVPLALTYGGFACQHLGTIKTGDFDIVSFWWLDAASASTLSGANDAVLSHSAGNQYRAGVSIYEAVDFDPANSRFRIGSNAASLETEFSQTSYDDGFAIMSYMLRGATNTQTCSLATEDVPVDVLDTDFYYGSFSGATNGSDVTATITASASRVAAAILVLEPESKTITGPSPVEMIQEQVNAATYSTIDADFVGGKFKKVTQACTVTVEPGMLNLQPASFIATTSGMITFAAGTGVTIISPDGNLSTRVQGSPVTLVQDSDTPETYYLFGDLA